jgi:glycosyltransferase involved in cell wall biosynthesis
MAKVVIVSLRFNPAFIQFLIAYAKAVRALGHEPAFLLDPAYRRFTELEKTAPVFGVQDGRRGQSWTHAIILNPSVYNRELAGSLKGAGTKILYVFHEPWQISIDHLRTEGFGGTVRAFLAHRATVPVLKLADTVILASRHGLDVYESADARYNGNSAYIPLIMDDEAPANVAEDLDSKQRFGFIGALCRSHGFDQYVALMREAFRRGGEFRFLIASRNLLPKAILKDPLLRGNQDRIEVRCGRPLNNEEMNRCYAECFCVWNLYRRSTQSAVLPKAFMFGVPVIASRIGAFPEYVEDGVNGRFAEAEDTAGILSSLAEMRGNLASYAVNCRRTFLSTFFYESQLPAIARLIQ